MPVPQPNFGDLMQRADRLLESVNSTNVGTSLQDNSFLLQQHQSKFSPFVQKSAQDQARASWQTKSADEKGAKLFNMDVKPEISNLNWSAVHQPRDEISAPSSSSFLNFSNKLKAAVDSLPANVHHMEDDSLAAGITQQIASSSRLIDNNLDENETDLDRYLRNERENILVSLIEETIRNNSKRMEEKAMKAVTDEWEEKKKKLMPTSIPVLNLPEAKLHRYFPAAGLNPKVTMSEWQVRFAEAVSTYLEQKAAGGITPKMIDIFRKIVDNSKNEKFKDIWQQVSYMLDTHFLLSGQSIFEIRQSTKFKISCISQALKYLEQQFVRQMQMIVYGNLEQGQLGGVPGMLNLVKAYLNIKLPVGYQNFEDGLLNEHPIWAVIYHCLRAGDFRAALSACSGHESQVVVEFGSILNELLKSNVNRLSGNSETQFNMLWRTIGRSSLDPYKKVCFCVLNLCDVSMDHAEIADKFEHWLWIKLRQALLTESGLVVDAAKSTTADKSSFLAHSFNKSGYSTPTTTASASEMRSKLPLDRLQRQITLDYGENHFTSGDSPLLYWTALWLSGQFEAAVEFLFRQGQEQSSSSQSKVASNAYDCHAVHIALVLHESGLLLSPADCNSKILSLESSDSPINYRLNLVRMLILYVTSFQGTDLKDALNYLYFLKSFKNTDNENLFFVAIKDLLAETKEYELLLGRLDDRGTKIPGLVDDSKFCIDNSELIRYVASDAEKCNSLDTAIILYDLSENHTKVLKLLNECLCQVVTQVSLPGSKRERFLNLATLIALRYRDFGHKGEEHVAVTFFQLMDISTFFDLFHENDYTSAFEVIRRIKLVPLTLEEVDQFVKQFFMVPDEVRRVLPEILLACMSILSSQHKEARGDRSFFISSTVVDETVKTVKQSAKALVQYAAMIPYRLPGDTAARLVQMETFMH